MKSKKFDADVDAYVARAEAFAQPIMSHLRGLIHKHCPEVVEQMKWGIPHFDYRGEMLCILAAHKNHCSFTFWKESLMSDARLKENPNLKAIKRFMGKLTSLADLPADKELVGYLKEAMELNDKGVKLAKQVSDRPKDIAVPDYLEKRLAANPKAREVFNAKSASFRKEYLIWITEAKTEATRDKRMDEALDWISEGKGRFWKYEKK